MVDSLAGVDGDILDSEAFARAQRKTAIGLASVALDEAGGDRERAAELLREPLQAIGVLPYQRSAGKYHYGKPPPDEAA